VNILGDGGAGVRISRRHPQARNNEAEAYLGIRAHSGSACSEGASRRNLSERFEGTGDDDNAAVDDADRLDAAPPNLQPA
jgi:hypothetical protein